MKVGMVFGKKILLTDIMYKSLLRRFDTKKFVRINTRWYNNDSICPLCNKYNCNNCPI